VKITTIDTVSAGEELAVQKTMVVDKALAEIATVEAAPKTPVVVPEAALVQAAAWQSANQQTQDSIFSSHRTRRLIYK